MKEMEHLRQAGLGNHDIAGNTTVEFFLQLLIDEFDFAIFIQDEEAFDHAIEKGRFLSLGLRLKIALVGKSFGGVILERLLALDGNAALIPPGLQEEKNHEAPENQQRPKAIGEQAELG